MRKRDYLRTHTLEEYKEYLKKQAALTKKWRENNREKSQAYGRDYYRKKKGADVERSNNGQKH